MSFFRKNRSNKLVKQASARGEPIKLETLTNDQFENSEPTAPFISIPILQQKTMQELLSKKYPLEYVSKDIENIRSEKDINTIIDKAKQIFDNEFKTYLLQYSFKNNEYYNNIYNNAYDRFMKEIIEPKIKTDSNKTIAKLTETNTSTFPSTHQSTHAKKNKESYV